MGKEPPLRGGTARVPGGATVASFTQGRSSELPVSPFLLPDVQIQSKFPQVACTRIQGGLGGSAVPLRQWGLFQVRAVKQPVYPGDHFWKASGKCHSWPPGPVETARGAAECGRRCCVFRWPWLGCVCKKHKPRWFDPAALEPRGWCSHLAKGPGTPLSNPVPGRGEWKFRVPGSLLCNQLMLPRPWPRPTAGPLSKTH